MSRQVNGESRVRMECGSGTLARPSIDREKVTSHRNEVRDYKYLFKPLPQAYSYIQPDHSTTTVGLKHVASDIIVDFSYYYYQIINKVLPSDHWLQWYVDVARRIDSPHTQASTD